MRLIDADEVKAKIESTLDMHDLYLPYRFQNILNEMPTVNPVEHVKHGEWRYDEVLELEWCSECGFGKRKGDKRWYSYCPNCGAQMKGVETK